MPRIEFTPLTEFAFNQVQSLIETMKGGVAATVDPGGRDPGKVKRHWQFSRSSEQAGGVFGLCH